MNSISRTETVILSTPPHSILVPSSPPRTPTKKHKNISPLSSPEKPKQSKRLRAPETSSLRVLQTPKSASVDPAITFIWQQFLPLVYCPYFFELPINRVTQLIESVHSKTEDLHTAKIALIKKICELVLVLPPNTMLFYKKETPISNPIQSETTYQLPYTFYISAQAEKTIVCICTKDFIGAGSAGKVWRAVGMLFTRTQQSLEFVRYMEVVKHSSLLNGAEQAREFFRTGQLDAELVRKDVGLLNRAKTRSHAAVYTKGIKDVVNPYFEGICFKGNKRKLILFFDQFTSDLFNFQNLIPDNTNVRRGITLQLAHSMGESLEKIHERGVIHRDIKDENVLVKYKEVEHSFPVLEEVGIGDFDLSRTPASSDLWKKNACGTLRYASPEMIARMLNWERFFERLAVNDATELMGPSVDTWGMGLILYNNYYGKYPACIYLMNECEKISEKIEDGTIDADFGEQLLQKNYKEVEDFFLASLEKEENEKTPAQPTLPEYINCLLRIDPRKRPTDAELVQMRKYLS